MSSARGTKTDLKFQIRVCSFQVSQRRARHGRRQKPSPDPQQTVATLTTSWTEVPRLLPVKDVDDAPHCQHWRSARMSPVPAQTKNSDANDYLAQQMIMLMMRERHHELKSLDEHGTKGAGQAANATSRKIQK